MINDSISQKSRHKKNFITNQAISKIPDSYNLEFLSESENILFANSVKTVLIKSMKNNESNEVAVVADNTNIALTYGDEHGVNLDSNYLARDIIRLSKDTVIVSHNHPSLETFSIDDLQYFFMSKSIKVFSVVSNLGSVEIIYRRNGLDAVKELKLLGILREIMDNYKVIETIGDKYELTKKFVKALAKNVYYRRL